MNPVLFRWVQGKVQSSSERCVRTGDTFSRADRFKMRPRVSRASGSIIHYLNARLRTCKDFAGLFHWLRHLLTPAPMLFCLGAHMRYAGAGPTSRPSCKRVAAFVRASSSNGPIRSWWPPLRALFSILLSVCLSLMWISENQSDLVPLAFRGHPALAAPPRRLTSPQWPPLGPNPLCARTTSWWGGVRVCVCVLPAGVIRSSGRPDSRHHLYTLSACEKIPVPSPWMKGTLSFPTSIIRKPSPVGLQ